MSKILKSLVAVAALLSVVSCEPNPTFVPVSQYLLDMVPYQAGQVLTFTNLQDGSTIQSSVTKTVESFQVDACATCEGPEEREVIVYKLTRPAPAGMPLARIEMNGGTENIVFMTVAMPTQNDLGFGFDIQTANQTADYQCAFTGYTCHESITLNDIAYNDVLEMSRDFDSVMGDELTKVYYSKTKGLIRLETEEGIVYQVNQ